RLVRAGQGAAGERAAQAGGSTARPVRAGAAGTIGAQAGRGRDPRIARSGSRRDPGRSSRAAKPAPLSRGHDVLAVKDENGDEGIEPSSEPENTATLSVLASPGAWILSLHDWRHCQECSRFVARPGTKLERGQPRRAIPRMTNDDMMVTPRADHSGSDTT